MSEEIHLKHPRDDFVGTAPCSPWVRGRENITSNWDEVTCEGCLKTMGKGPKKDSGPTTATDERIELLAEAVLQRMELEDVVCFVRERLIIDYIENDELFQEDWDFHMGE